MKFWRTDENGDKVAEGEEDHNALKKDRTTIILFLTIKHTNNVMRTFKFFFPFASVKQYG